MTEPRWFLKLRLRDVLWLVAVVAIGCVVYQRTMEARSLRAELNERKQHRSELERSLKAMTRERDFHQEMAVALEAALIAKGHSASVTRDTTTGQLRVVDLPQCFP